MLPAIDNTLLDDLLAQAAASPRLRMNYDLRTSADDKSQRMLNALLPGTVMPIHRHRDSAETVIILRGRFDEIFYDDSGVEVARYHLDPSTGEFGVQVPAGQWHSLVALEPSVLFEAKDGAWEPLKQEDIMKNSNLDILKQQITVFINHEARSCSMDFGCITPEYIYRMWGNRVALEDIRNAMKH